MNDRITNSNGFIEQSKSVNFSSENWKDVVNGYFDKSLALAILFILFAIIVSPELTVKPYELPLEGLISIYLPIDLDPIKAKLEVVRPIIDIIIDEEMDTESQDIPMVISIPPTVLDPWKEQELPVSLKTFKNKYYEDAPVTLKAVRPIYPQFYKNIGVEGTVILEAEILIDGTIGQIEVFHSIAPGKDGLDERAINALRQWKFKPAKVNNNPVAIWVKLPFEFKLE